MNNLRYTGEIALHTEEHGWVAQRRLDNEFDPDVEFPILLVALEKPDKYDLETPKPLYIDRYGRIIEADTLLEYTNCRVNGDGSCIEVTDFSKFSSVQREMLKSYTTATSNFNCLSVNCKYNEKGKCTKGEHMGLSAQDLLEEGCASGVLGEKHIVYKCGLKHLKTPQGLGSRVVECIIEIIVKDGYKSNVPIQNAIYNWCKKVDTDGRWEHIGRNGQLTGGLLGITDLLIDGSSLDGINALLDLALIGGIPNNSREWDILLYDIKLMCNILIGCEAWKCEEVTDFSENM